MRLLVKETEGKIWLVKENVCMDRKKNNKLSLQKEEQWKTSYQNCQYFMKTQTSEDEDLNDCWRER